MATAITFWGVPVAPYYIHIGKFTRTPCYVTWQLEIDSFTYLTFNNPDKFLIADFLKFYYWLKTVNPNQPIIPTYGNTKIHANLFFSYFIDNAEPIKNMGRAYMIYLNFGVEPKYQDIGIAKTAPKIINQILLEYIPIHTRTIAVIIPGHPISALSNP